MSGLRFEYVSPKFPRDLIGDSIAIARGGEGSGEGNSN